MAMRANGVSTGKPASMISDGELWQCAGEVIRQHGESSAQFVAERLGALVLADDWEGVAVWKAIARRIDQLQRSVSSEDQHLH